MGTPLTVFAALILAAPLCAQTCPGFASGLGTPGADAPVNCSVLHDDGSGPALYIGGQFHSVGSVAAIGIARWDGTTWSSVGGGFGPTVGNQPMISCLASLNGRLYAGGNFGFAGTAVASHLAVWDGMRWSQVPGEPNGIVRALAVDNGVLLVGGDFTSAGGSSFCIHIGRFGPMTGTWTPMGYGLSTDSVRCIATYPGATGTDVLVGGSGIWMQGGYGAIVRWDGSTWDVPGGGLTSFSGGASVSAMTVFDEGMGPRVYACGYFDLTGSLLANSIASWDGSSWSPVGASALTYLNPNLRCLAAHDDGTGMALYVGGDFNSVQGVTSPNLVRYRNGAFTALPTTPNRAVSSLISFQGKLVVGGIQSNVGSVHTTNLSSWQGGAWHPVTPGASLSVGSFATYDDGSGPALYAANGSGGPTIWANFARWSQGAWTPIVSPVDVRPALLVAGDDGSGAGPSLFAYGSYPDAAGTLHLAVLRWNSGGWTNLTPGHIQNFITDMKFFDDGAGPKLYVCGYFTSIDGVPANRVARWNGSTWSAMGQGFDTGFNVEALCVYDDGTGPALYAGGSFRECVSRWTGTTWASLAAGGPEGGVEAMATYNDGTGTALYVAGGFNRVSGGIPVHNIARLKNGAWSDVGGGIDGGVYELATFDDGTGAALYATGMFTQAGTTAVANLARWNGSVWSDVHGGLDHPASQVTFTPPSGGGVLYVHDDGQGPSLWIAGSFGTAGDVVSSSIARLDNCFLPGVATCAGDGSGTSCPCGNDSAPGQGVGCLDSFGTGGRLTASGLPSLSHDSLVFAGSGMPDSFALYFQGTQLAGGGAGTVFGDGLRCAVGSIQRLGAALNAQGASRYPPAGAQPVHVKGNITAPGMRSYQVWFRNAAPYCTPSTFNLTNGWRVTWYP